MPDFRDFITDSARDPQLAGEFYTLVAREDFTNNDIKTWLDGKGYTYTDRQIHKIGRVRDAVDRQFNCWDRDY